MDVESLSKGAGAAAKIKLGVNETVTVESGAMIAMSPHLKVETTSVQRGAKSGVLSGIKRLFAGEHFFLNHFTATNQEGEMIIGPTLLGDVIEHQILDGTLIVQGGSWLASEPTVQLDTTWQGFSSALLSGEGLFWIACTGQGKVVLNSFGAIYSIDVDGSYTVDTGHIVAFEDTLSFKIGKAGASWIGSFLGGEGLVCKFEGQGRLYCQTHNPPRFGQHLGPLLLPR